MGSQPRQCLYLGELKTITYGGFMVNHKTSISIKAKHSKTLILYNQFRSIL